jgi:hypothetical protein
MKIFKWLFGGAISDAVSTIIDGVSGAVRDAGSSGDQLAGELKAVRSELAELNARIEKLKRTLWMLLAAVAVVSIVQLIFVLLIFYTKR